MLKEASVNESMGYDPVSGFKRDKTPVERTPSVMD